MIFNKINDIFFNNKKHILIKKMENEILNKNKVLFLKTLLNLYLEMSKKDLKKLCMDSGSKMIDSCRTIISFYNDFFILDMTAKKIFKTDYPVDPKYLKYINENKKYDETATLKIHPAREIHDVLDNYTSALVLSYLSTADGAPVSEEWISYCDLKDGLFYAGTIPHALKPICTKYEKDFTGFLKKAEAIGGIKSELYKNAVIIRPFKRFPMMFLLYEKDSEFECEIKVLFSKSANHYLKTDVIKQVLVQTVNRLVS